MKTPSTRWDIENAIVEHLYCSNIKGNRNLSAILSLPELGQFDEDLADALEGQSRREFLSGIRVTVEWRRVLKNHISILRSKYDYILIDCPPSLSLFTSNAIVASDYFVTPISPEYLSKQGLDLIMGRISRLRQRLADVGIDFAGCIINRVDIRRGDHVRLCEEIYGHSEIKDRLIRTMVDKRVSHAIMLYGPEGSGKFALALAYAQLLQCSGEKNGDSCGECASCQQAAKLIHPDIHFVFPVVKGKVSNTEQNDNKRANSDGKKGSTDPVSDNFIASWRSFISESPYPGLQSWLQYLDVENKQGGIFKMEAEALIKKLSLKAFESEFKVVIFWLPEKMNPTTANKLLKININYEKRYSPTILFRSKSNLCLR